ncbi:hypothetical protein F2Q69_00052584 [Brassica cretica]|uniref:Uncharacterized protein n=1 Tax=Brassica cretica TaxID=69181 RepID=A0A8S9MZF0_BRACR|nr:hypothetical protein F2Q69_00052584 [Brassica cretica]
MFLGSCKFDKEKEQSRDNSRRSRVSGIRMAQAGGKRRRQIDFISNSPAPPLVLWF